MQLQRVGTIIPVFSDHLIRKNTGLLDYVDRDFTITVYVGKTFGRVGQVLTIFGKVNVRMVGRSRGPDQYQGLLSDRAASGRRYTADFHDFH